MILCQALLVGALLSCGAGFSCLAAAPEAMDFLLLDPEPATGESLGMVTSIARSPSDESLWIGMDGDGILRIGRNGRRIRYTSASSHLVSDRISQLVFLPDGTLYILADNGQLVRYPSVEGFRPVSGLSCPVSAISPGPGPRLFLSLSDGSVWAGSSASAFQPFCQAAFPAAVIVPASDCLYLGGARAGEIAVFSSDGTQTGRFPGLPLPANCLAVSSSDSLFAGTDNGLYCFSEGNWQPVDIFGESTSRRVQSLLFDAGNRLWIASRAGLSCVDVSKTNVSKSEQFFSEQAFLPRASYIGLDGCLYFGSVRGVAAVSASDGIALAPWTMEPEPQESSPHASALWIIVAAILALSLGIVLGRRIRPRPVVEPVTPVAPATPQQMDPPAPDDSSVQGTPVVQAASVDTESVQVPSRPRVVKPVGPVPPAVSPSELIARVRQLESEPSEGFVSEVLPLIQASLTDPKFSVEDIASALHLSRVHVNRKLQAELGISPSLLIKASRMSVAVDLLLQNEIPVAEIASRTGFSSASYFSSAFREFFGVSPREYLSRPDMRP